MTVLSNSGKGKVVVIAVAAALIVGCLAGVAVMKGSGMANKAEAKGPTVMVPVGEIVVNLADTDAIRYLKVDLVLEMRGEGLAGGGGHGGEAGGEVTTRVRDAIIQILSSKHFKDLLKAEGKDKVKKEIIVTVNERIKDAEVVEVFFNEFAMQ